MTQPHSSGLRERVVRAHLPGETIRQVAARFGVSVSSVPKWVARYRATGSVAPGRIGGHRQDRQRLAPAPRIAREPDRHADLRRRRRARLSARPAGPRDPRTSAGQHLGRRHRRQAGRRCGRGLDRTRPHVCEVRGHRLAARRRPRHREDRGELGRDAQRPPGGLPPGLDRARQCTNIQPGPVAEGRSTRPANPPIRPTPRSRCK